MPTSEAPNLVRKFEKKTKEYLSLKTQIGSMFRLNKSCRGGIDHKLQTCVKIMQIVGKDELVLLRNNVGRLRSFQ